MGMGVAEKIISSHVLEGEMFKGEEISFRVDQTLCPDSSGTMSFLEFECIGLPKVQTEFSIAYIDHNLTQLGFENPDDHRFLQTVTQKYGAYCSKAGNGIQHQVHLEQFARPGKVLAGADSHTPTAGGVGMLALGVGGLELAVAMGGGGLYIKMPKIYRVLLSGKLKPWCSGKDVILELLRRLTVKGGLGKIFEYQGSGVETLSVYDRATICNMGTELGATTSVFPSDEVTRQFMKMHGRDDNWIELKADQDAIYDETIEINLSELVPMIAKPHSPDNVVPVSEVAGLKVHQVIVGSCTNSSYKDLMIVAKALVGKKVHPDVSMGINPGSRRVYHALAQNGALATLVGAGVRILELGCGPCCGMGVAPESGGVSVRTVNRNFKARSGTTDAQVYLASPEVAVACAITGVITDPRDLGAYPEIILPESFVIEDNLLISPSDNPSEIEVIKGPNIKPVPINAPLDPALQGKLLLKLGDNITTDDIIPSGAKIMSLRSNIPSISDYAFCKVDETFVARCKEAQGGFIIAGNNYGQGSSREHAALIPMYLGIKAVIAKSFARIHGQNLVNFGIIPLVFINEDDYDSLSLEDILVIPDVKDKLIKGLNIEVETQSGKKFACRYDLSRRQIEMILAGGLLNYTKNKQ